MSSDTKCNYPGIIYLGPIQKWQKTVYPESGSLFFAFIRARTDYSEVRSVLTLNHREDAFDAMRKLEHSDEKYDMIVEAHFLRPADRSEVLSKALLKEDVIFDFSIQDSHGYHYASGEFTYKVFPSVPILGPYTIYRLQDLPLASSTDVCAAVKKSVLSMLMQKLVKYEKKDVLKHLVDIVLGYDEENNRLFDGTLSIVLKDFIGVFLNFDSIVIFGKMFKPTDCSTHYVYCKRCKSLDSHLLEDCPRPTSSTNI